MPIVRRKVIPRRKKAIRLALASAASLLLIAVGWTAYSVWQVSQDLRDSRTFANRMVAAVTQSQYDQMAREGDLLFASARSAAERTGGWWWGVMSSAPVLGDDAAAIAAVSASIDQATSQAVVPLLRTLRVVDRVSVDGRLDTDLMDDLQPEAQAGADAIRAASAELEELDPDRYLDSVGEAVAEWKIVVGQAARTAQDAAVTLDVLPDLVGAERPQRFLLVFENNAEVRATGGLPGSWSLVEADEGRLEILRQGSGGGIDEAVSRVPTTSPAERSLWGPQLGLYFRDANMTSDFPRAAELMRQHWSAFGGAPIDGVVSVDVVSLAYLLEGLGPVEVSGVNVTDANVRQALLNGIYERLEPDVADAVFEEFARVVVDRLTTSDILSAPDLLIGVGRSIVEDRLHVAWFDEELAGELARTRLSGAFETRASRTPLVDVTLNDATGSKMSYFLRHEVDVTAVGCEAGRQVLEGTMRIWQTVRPSEARGFDDYVTGGGVFGVPPGNQVVLTRVFGPVGGRITEMEVAGEPVDPAVAGPPVFEGRPVMTLALQPDFPPATEITWTMVTGRGQPGDVRLRVTPGAAPGNDSGVRPSACS